MITLEGKKREFLKSFKIIEIANVPRNKIMDIKNTSGTYTFVSQPPPANVPLYI